MQGGEDVLEIPLELEDRLQVEGLPRRGAETAILPARVELLPGSLDRVFLGVEQVLDELTQTGCGVLSTGGGAVLRTVNRQRLRERTTTVYLHSLPEDVFKRLRHDQNRPLLQVADPLGRLRELYATRDPLYRETAHFVIETGRPSVAGLVNMIVMQLELAGLVETSIGATPSSSASTTLSSG